MKKSALAILLLCTLTGSAAFAGKVGPIFYSLIPATGSASKTETKAFAGLNWRLDGGMTPALVLGAFRAKVQSDGDTSGGSLAFHLNLAGGIKPGKIKLGYINGKENFQGEAAIGYDFLKNAPLLGLGLNAPHISAGVDAYTGPGFVPYVTLHSQGKFDKPNQTPAQCVVDPLGIYADPSCTTPIP
jgi:hypothetical protein